MVTDPIVVHTVSGHASQEFGYPCASGHDAKGRTHNDTSTGPQRSDRGIARWPLDEGNAALDHAAARRGVRTMITMGHA